uniref:Myotubularin phosphatase domain-containing protein n=1 Tax=Macrostomum lignano TaxID=282301 RepID=A0A1I8FSY5_9PLAT
HQIIWMAQVNSKQHEQSLLITHLLSRMQSAEYNASLIGEWPEFIAQLSSSIEQIILRDYRLCDAALDNESGQVCATYPPRIFLPTGLATKLLTSSASKQFRYPRRLSDLCCSAAGARVRGRLPLPALICQGRLLCRSATLSAWPTGEEARGYADFRRLHLPYPGCDFFSNWPAVDGAPLRYDWTGQAATLRLNGRLPACAAAIAWQEYRSWDLDRLTANYLLIMLGYLTESGLAQMAGAGGDGADGQCSGLLLHCLSGWDRTPLFVSLIRLLLWSEGLAHASLSPSEILRLCLGYDWFLWGHRLPDRLAKGQRILEYCFHFVGLAADLPELSMVSHYPLIAGGSGDHCSNPNGMTRAEKLRAACQPCSPGRCVDHRAVPVLMNQAARLLVPTAASHWLALLPGPSWASCLSDSMYRYMYKTNFKLSLLALLGHLLEQRHDDQDDDGGSKRGHQEQPEQHSVNNEGQHSPITWSYSWYLRPSSREAGCCCCCWGLAKPLGPAAVAAEAVGLSSVAPRLAMVPRRLSSSMMALSAAVRNCPLQLPGLPATFLGCWSATAGCGDVESIRAARLKKKCFSLGGTGLSFGPMWCRWSTNTVSTIDSDVVDMVTVR